MKCVNLALCISSIKSPFHSIPINQREDKGSGIGIVDPSPPFRRSNLEPAEGKQIRYRSPSSAELLEAQTNSPPSSSDHHHRLLSSDDNKMLKRPPGRGGGGDSFSDKLYRHRSLILVVSVPILLLTTVLYVMPSQISDPTSNFSHRKVTYAVIFDAGSSGSRVHVFSFDQNTNLLPIGKDLELFIQTKPGLSFYATNPRSAAASLTDLLRKAEAAVPKDLRPFTPVRVGATAGLRALEGDASDRILQAVRDLLKQTSSLSSAADSVLVIDGTQEGSFQWVTINYLLGNLGKRYSETVGVVDLGGGSVQMAYAISDEDAVKAPKLSDGEDSYVRKMTLKGTNYNLYVHSYLHYGLLAARAEILKVSDDSGNPCILVGYDGSYKYGGESFKAASSSSGSSLDGCRRVTMKALKVNEATCTHMKCTFGGVWNGGGGDGQRNLFVASFFFDRAAEAGFVNPNDPVAKVHPGNFEEAAKRACRTKLEDAKSTYPDVEEGNLPYLCMDLVYQFTLLVDGFGLDPWQEITLVKKVKYNNALVEAAWPLGSAIEAVSALN